jgi:hypothetical protein
MFACAVKDRSDSRKVIRLNFKAYHLTRITPVLNGTREHVFINSGVAEAVIRAQRTTSTTPKYKVSQCIRPILSWARIVHADYEKSYKIGNLMNFSPFRASNSHDDPYKATTPCQYNSCIIGILPLRLSHHPLLIYRQ